MSLRLKKLGFVLKLGLRSWVGLDSTPELALGCGLVVVFALTSVMDLPFLHKDFRFRQLHR